MGEDVPLGCADQSHIPRLRELLEIWIQLST